MHSGESGKCRQPALLTRCQVDGCEEDPFGRFGRSFDGYVEDKAVKGAQIPKPSAGNDDTAAFCSLAGL
jgi:hypothetical protein